jgi:hypothetical protein
MGWVTALVLAALAEPPDPTSAWLVVTRDRGAEGCPDGRALAVAIEAELGQAPFANRPGPPVRCLLARDQGGWSARIEIVGEGERPASTRIIRAQGASCRQLASAVELTLVLALGGRPASLPPEPDPAIQVFDPEVPAGLAAPVAHPRGPWSVSGGAVLSTGALLELAAGLELGGRWRRGRFAVAVEARGDRALPMRLGTGTVDGWRVSGAVLPCFAPEAAGLCGVIRAGAFRAVSQGLTVSRARPGGLVEAGGRLTVYAGAGPLTLALYAEAAFPLINTRLLVDQRAIWESPAVVLSLGLTALAGR